MSFPPLRPEPGSFGRRAGGAAPAGPRDDLLSFVVGNAREHVVVYDAGQSIVFRNRKAERFLERNALPKEVPALARKIHAAIVRREIADRFPGQIRFHKELGGTTWAFRVAFREGERPLVAVYFDDETVSGRFDLNALRRQYRLTRREADVLRHLLDGRRNLEIAEELSITEQTVKDYLSSVYNKVGVPDRFALLVRFINLSEEFAPLPG